MVRAHSRPVQVLRRFRQRGDAVLRFVCNCAVPFTNNTADRAVRTFDGAEYFCVIRSRLDTLRKQGHNMLAVLQHAFGGTVNQPLCLFQILLAALGAVFALRLYPIVSSRVNP